MTAFDSTRDSLFSDEIETPLGPLRFWSTLRGVCALAWIDRWGMIENGLARRFGTTSASAKLNSASGPLSELTPNPSPRMRERLLSYFKGELEALEDLPDDARGTSFQERVWRALREIRPGDTISYGALATSLGSPNSVRAVANANARNPVSLIVPCHRVIGSDGSLTGYAGGLERKRWLLRHEGAFATPQLSLPV